MTLLKQKNKIKYFFMPLSLLILWQILSAIKTPFISLYLLPSPYELLPSIKNLILGNGNIYFDILISFLRVVTSFLIASLVGIFLAIAAYKSITVQNIIIPIINILRPIPNIVWLPIIIVIIPSSEISILAIPFMGALPPIFLSAFTGLERIPSGIKNQAIIKNISGIKEIFGILIPGAFSHIRNGVNVGIGIAWMGVVLAEMTAGKNGIGYFTWIAYQSTNYSYMLIGAIIIAISGFLSSKIFLKITKKSFHGLYI